MILRLDLSATVRCDVESHRDQSNPTPLPDLPITRSPASIRMAMAKVAI
jgi:hypothetical protein